jgi:hypothetical protein
MVDWPSASSRFMENIIHGTFVVVNKIELQDVNGNSTLNINSKIGHKKSM